jgi:hypothetical protein
MPAPHYSRRAFLAIALGGLAAAPAWASGPVTLNLTKTTMGDKFRVKVYAKVVFGAVNVNNQYMGYVDVPFGGTTIKTFEKEYANMKLMLKLAFKALQKHQQLQVEAISNFAGIVQTRKFSI